MHDSLRGQSFGDSGFVSSEIVPAQTRASQATIGIGSLQQGVRLFPTLILTSFPSFGAHRLQS